MNPLRSALDGLDPRVRFAVTTATAFAVILVLALLVFRDSAGAALGTAAAGTFAGVGTRAYQVGTWPWRSPGDDQDPT